MTARQQFLAGLAVLSGLCTAAPAAAEPAAQLAAAVQQRLADAPVLRGQFEQNKTLKGFKHPLVSRGDFLLSRERGVVWHVRQPFESTLVVTHDRVLSRQADGHVDTRVDARDEPGVRAVNEMLFALAAGDLPVLSQRFDLSGELAGAQAWHIVLVPRDTALAQWLKRIELDGARYVRTVTLQEAQGDITVIQFTGQGTAGGLTREEAAGFD